MLVKPKYCNNYNIEYFYEIHITVETQDIQGFKVFCNANNIKPIFIDFQLTNTFQINDVMTSTTLKSNDKDIWTIANEQILLLSTHYVVKRVKIETEPNHYLSPKDSNEFIDQCQYFESHIAIHTSPTQLAAIKEVCKYEVAHMSRNPFKVYADGNITQMCTIRSWDGLDEFSARVQQLYLKLLKLGTVTLPIKEFVLYDSNIAMDKEWIPTDTYR